MNMKELLPRSRSMQEAAEAKKGLVWILELLIFVVAGLLIGLIIRVPFIHLNHFIEKRMEDTKVL